LIGLCTANGRRSTDEKTFTIVAVAALGLFSAVPVPAQEAAAVNHVLKSTLFDEESTIKKGFLPKPGLYILTTPVSFSCTAACTLEVEIMEQLGGNTTAKNNWDICAAIDKTDTPCLFQGTLPTDSSFVMGNYIWSMSLPAGAHTAQPLVGVEAGPARIGSFHITYHVYQP
jgi:hypothetical protein